MRTIIGGRFAEGRKGALRPSMIMKRKYLVCMLLAGLLLALAGVALAETDPIVCNMEVNPSNMTEPGTVTVTITISNSGATDMKDPVELYNPVSQLVTDFGTNGAVLLKAGESQKWTGPWDVNQRTLQNGTLVFFVKYTLYKDSGESYKTSQPIRGKLSYQAKAADAAIEVKRTISPAMARKDQTVTIKYDIINTGAADLQNISIQENKEIAKDPQKLPSLPAGETAQMKFTVKMGSKDMTSKATVSFSTADSKKVETRNIEAATIAFGEPAMNATLTSSAKGVAVNGKVTLTLELKNNGNIDYSDLQVSDPTLGEVFSNLSLEKKGSLKKEKEVTIPKTIDFQFTITAIDNTGTKVSLVTDALTITAMDPSEALALTLVATPDRTEVYDGRVRFSVTISNDSKVEAKNVTVLHGTTKIYTFASIPAGETRNLTRDASLSMAGKYQFTATAQDPAENTLSFHSNEMQIAFTITPEPIAPTPIPAPTAEPVFVPVTMPPIGDQSIAFLPKMIQSIMLPVFIIGGLLLIASGVLLVIASKRRAEQRKSSEAAYDHLERAKRRDYVTPAEEEEELPIRESEKESRRDNRPSAMRVQNEREKEGKARDLPLDDVELPHLKYVRDAYSHQAETSQRDTYRKSPSLYDDEDLYGAEDVYTRRSENDVMYEEPYDDTEGGYQEDSHGDGQGPYYADEGYAQEYNETSNQGGYEAYGEEYDTLEENDPYYGDDRVSEPYGQGEEEPYEEREERDPHHQDARGRGIGY